MEAPPRDEPGPDGEAPTDTTGDTVTADATAGPTPSTVGAGRTSATTLTADARRLRLDLGDRLRDLPRAGTSPDPIPDAGPDPDEDARFDELLALADGVLAAEATAAGARLREEHAASTPFVVVPAAVLAAAAGLLLIGLGVLWPRPLTSTMLVVVVLLLGVALLVAHLRGPRTGHSTRRMLVLAACVVAVLAGAAALVPWGGGWAVAGLAVACIAIAVPYAGSLRPRSG